MATKNYNDDVFIQKLNRNILDFNENGGATIEIKEVHKDYSLTLNHWTSLSFQLSDIKNDIAQTDSEEMRVFLVKSEKLLSEWMDLEEEEEEEESVYEVSEEKGEEYIKNLEKLFSTVNPDDIDIWKESTEPIPPEDDIYWRYKKMNIDIETEALEEEEFYEELDEYPQFLKVYNYKLKHSLMWYLKDRIHIEISIIKERINNLKGLKKISRSSKSTDKFIRAIRRSEHPIMAKDEIIKEFRLSDGQSWFLLNMKLRDITKANAYKGDIQENIEFLEEVIRFLKKLKS